MAYIEIGLGEGATIVIGGEAPTDPALADGAYLMPTVFDGVSNDMRIAREEIFGPVVSIIPFDTEEEALRLANATPYGLSGSIWSRDIGKALRAAKALQAGVISVNSNSSVHTEAPFGGYKMSGHRPRARDGRARPLHPFLESARVLLHTPATLAAELGCSKVEAFDRIERIRSDLRPFMYARLAPTDANGAAVVPAFQMFFGAGRRSPDGGADRPPWIEDFEANGALSHDGQSHVEANPLQLQAKP